jgi:AcrR family transcriptional regulator
MLKNTLKDPADLRVRRTQKLLWEALMALLAERELEAISVKDICDRAMVHRTTFYKHYEDKYNLLMKGMREIYDTLAAEADLPPDAFSWSGTLPVFIGFFNHVEKHQHFYYLMLCGDGIGKFQSLLRSYLAELCLARLQKTARSHSESALPLPLLAQFCAGTVISVTTWWLENNRPYPPEQMAGYVQKLLQSGCTLKQEEY